MKFNPAEKQLLTDPYPIYHRMRSHAPVIEGNPPVSWDGKFWYVFGFDEALNIIRLSSPLQERGTVKYGSSNSDQFWHRVSRWLLFLNEEEHRENREKIAESFKLTAVNAITDHIQRKSIELAKSVTMRNEFDLMHDYVYPLSTSTLCYLLGIDEIATGWLKTRTSKVAKVLGFSQENNDYLAAINAVEDIREFLICELKKPRKTGLLSNLAANSLNIEDDLDLIIQIMFAVPETSSDSTGTCIHMLWSRQEILELLMSKPDLLAPAIRECLRYDTSVQYSTIRKMQSSFQVGSQLIEKGDALMINFGSCNRDPRRFQNPDKFDVQRAITGPELTFGHGPHYCIGVHLARAQISIAVRTMLTYLGMSWQIQECTMKENHLFRGPQKLVFRKIKSHI